MSYCSYMNCHNRTHPLHTIPFFSLPTDRRREIWIKNSGNPELLKISPSTIRKFCEEHFMPKYFKRQFNRTLLTKDAIPIPYESFNTCEQEVEEVEEVYDEQLIEILEEEMVEEPDEDSNNKYFSPAKKKLKTENYSTELENYGINYEDDLQENQKSEMNLLHEENTALTNRVFELEKRTDNILSSCSTNVESQISVQPVKKITISTQTDFEEKIVEPAKIITETVIKQPEYTEDEHFALSLAGTIHRFGAEKKARAKLMMMKCLMEIETGVTLNF